MTGANCYSQMFVTLPFFNQPRSTLSWLFPVEMVCDGVITPTSSSGLPQETCFWTITPQKIRNICPLFVVTYAFYGKISSPS